VNRIPLSLGIDQKFSRRSQVSYSCAGETFPAGAGGEIEDTGVAVAGQDTSYRGSSGRAGYKLHGVAVARQDTG
jgi:hypothetical protein